MRDATIIGAALIVALTAGSCGRAVPAAGQEGGGSASETSPPSATAPKLLTLTYDKSRKPVPGTDVVATAEGLPANRKVTLLWGTVDGGWVIEGYSHFRGKKFADATKPLTQTEVDASGRLPAPLRDSGITRRTRCRHRRRRDHCPGGLRWARLGYIRRRTRRHADRTARHRPWAAHVGEHVGRELDPESDGRRDIDARHRGRDSAPAERSVITLSMS
jgi:hypothetical protein